MSPLRVLIYLFKGFSRFKRASDGTFFVSPKKVPQKKATVTDIQPGYRCLSLSFGSSVVNSGRIKPGYCCDSAMEFLFVISGFAVESFRCPVNWQIGLLTYWLIDQLRPQHFPRTTVIYQFNNHIYQTGLFYVRSPY